jgi:hypothetical protein
MEQHATSAAIRATPLNKLAKSQRFRLDENERRHEREMLTAAFVADHAREPSHFEAVLLDQAAGLLVLDRKRRRRGQASTDAARLLVRLLGRLGVRFGAAVKAPPVPLRDLVRRPVGGRPVASIAGSAIRPPADETRATDVLAQPARPSNSDGGAA